MRREEVDSYPNSYEVTDAISISNLKVAHRIFAGTQSVMPSMTIFLAVLTPTIGVISLIAGVFLNELLRRRNRRELYAVKIFEKRLAAYEGLADLVNDASEVAAAVIERSDLTKKERHDVMSLPIMSLAKYGDKHRLYLDDELSVHCTTLFIAVEDIHDANAEKSELLKRYYHQLGEARRMIAEDAGIAEINRLFKSINRPKLTGPVIEYMRELRQKKLQ